MKRFAVGERVRHEAYGNGTVVASVFGRRVRVQFDHAADLPRTIRNRELQSLNGLHTSEAAPKPEARGKAAPEPPARTTPSGPATTPAPSSTPTRPPAPTPPADEALATAAQPATGPGVIPLPAAPPDPTPKGDPDLLQVLEALRLGVVPSTHVRDYTVSRSSELAEIDRLLDAAGGARVVWGDYGAGKSHMLDAAQQLASERGYATSRIVLDPREVPPTHPKRLYRALVNRLALPGEAGRGLAPLLTKLAKSAPHRNPWGERRSRFFSPYLFALTDGGIDFVGWLNDYVHGDDVRSGDVNEVLKINGWTGDRVLALQDYRTFGRMYVHMLGTLASWSRDAGYKGLVLLIDEVELVDDLTPDQMHHALEVLKHLVAVTVPEDDLAFSPEEDLYKGGNQVHREIPLKFEPDQPLITLFALTPLDEIRNAFARIIRTDRYDLPLTPIGHTTVPELIERIVKLYRKAYPGFTLTPDQARSICDRIMDAVNDGEDSPRAIVRGTVFMLDAARLGDRS